MEALQHGVYGLHEKSSRYLMALVKREYQCPNEACGGERVETVDAAHIPFCEKCGNRMVWSPSAMTFSLKGPGWTKKE